MYFLQLKITVVIFYLGQELNTCRSHKCTLPMHVHLVIRVLSQDWVVISFFPSCNCKWWWWWWWWWSSSSSSSLITYLLSPATSHFEPLVHPTTQASNFKL